MPVHLIRPGGRQPKDTAAPRVASIFGRRVTYASGVGGGNRGLAELAAGTIGRTGREGLIGDVFGQTTRLVARNPVAGKGSGGTIIVVHSSTVMPPNGAGSVYCHILASTTGVNPTDYFGWILMLENGTGKPLFRTYQSGSGNESGSVLGSVPLNDGKVHVTIGSFEYASAGKLSLYVDGKTAADDAHGGDISAMTNNLAIGRTRDPFWAGLEGNIYAVMHLDGYINAAQAAHITRDFWRLFPAETIPLFFSTVTAQFLRPIADIANSGWTPSTGSDLFACIGEAVRNDSTYISAATPGAICEVLLGTSSGDPLSSINHLPRIVMSAGSGGIILRLKQGATVIKAWTYASLAGSDTLYEPTLTSGEIDAISDYAGLRLEMETTT